MKYLLPLLMVSSAAWAGTRDTDWDVRRLWAESAPPVAPHLPDPPWVTGALELAGVEGDRHAVSYADDEEDSPADVQGEPELALGECTRDEVEAETSFVDQEGETEDDGVWASGDQASGDPHAGLHPRVGDDPHAQIGTPDVSGPRAPLARATAPNGHAISELVARASVLREQMVRVRGLVVKRTDGILDQTYLHLRDGSGERGDADLTVVTTDDIPLGSTVEVEGQLEVDRDLGFGYRYPVLLVSAMRVGG